MKDPLSIQHRFIEHYSVSCASINTKHNTVHTSKSLPSSRGDKTNDKYNIKIDWTKWYKRNTKYYLLCLFAQSCPMLFDPMDCSRPGSSVHGDSPGKNTGVGCHAVLQGIFPAQGSNPGLLHCRQTWKHTKNYFSANLLNFFSFFWLNLSIIDILTVYTFKLYNLLI